MRQIDKRVFSDNKISLSIKLSLWYYIKTGCLKSDSPEIISSCSKIVNKGKNFNSRIGEKEYNRPREYLQPVQKNFTLLYAAWHFSVQFSLECLSFECRFDCCLGHLINSNDMRKNHMIRLDFLFKNTFKRPV